jgi:hypothetical protein
MISGNSKKKFISFISLFQIIMDLDVTAAKTKFTYVGEILPNNDRSNAILAQRRDEEQRKREEAERVSILCTYKLIFESPVVS